MESIDFPTYKRLVQSVGSLSYLFSESETPYLVPRFVENLFIYTSQGKNQARVDMSYDAIMPNRSGVGVKTISAAGPDSSKSEKVAEFTAHATKGYFSGKSNFEIAQTVSVLRNQRVLSDSRAYGVDVESSFYHCLVRFKGGCRIHEEPYPLIDTNNLKMLPGRSRNPVFTDGKNEYSFSLAKNTLFKKFQLGHYSNSEIIEIKLLSNPMELLISGKLNLDFDEIDQLEASHTLEQKSVILPLYSTTYSEVRPASGINQWNAGGRRREFGEAYIPHPKKVRSLFPDFFPGRDQPFTLELPDGTTTSAKICQADGKALMSNPNTALVNWLFAMIDVDDSKGAERLAKRIPFTYEDLVKVGRDSVKVTNVDSEKRVYRIEPAPLGSYEAFIESQTIEGK